jgi:hypothetical protein
MSLEYILKALSPTPGSGLSSNLQSIAIVKSEAFLMYCFKQRR